jgi:hypothetical protein
MNESFSKRHGFQPKENEITVRQDAPYELRGVVIDIAYEAGFRPKTLRPVICGALRKRADQNNWSEYPNIDDEIHMLLDECEWYQVYDVIEHIYHSASQSVRFGIDGIGILKDRFEREINSYFKTEGIGWQLIKGKVEVRGAEGFETAVHKAYSVIEQSGLRTPSNEIHEAVSDLSRRPNPDITGAIQHSMAALECVAREVCGDKKATLGEILKRFEHLIPKPLDKAIAKTWGFASEMGRHLREGREPTFEEAELLVGLCASLSVYLMKKGDTR